MNLSDLIEGEKGIITKVKGRGAFRKRISEMGFVRGKAITRIKDAPLKDPIEFKLMDFNVSLRKSEAEQIEVISEHGVHINGTSHYPATTTEQLLKNEAKEKEKVIEVTLVGNPNCGKTSLFNFASGGNERVGNYSGVTISAKEGVVKIRDYTIKIIDLPGTYSLSAFSPEEAYVRKYIIDEQPDIVINVADASNLERNLYLTTQLIDMDITVVMALNMYDELSKKGNELDTLQLGYLLGIPIIPTTAYKGIGLKELFEEVIKIYEEKEAVLRHIHIHYGEDIEASLHAIQTEIWKNKTITDKVSSRLLALQLLEKDKSVHQFLSRFNEYPRINEVANHEIVRIEKQFHEDSATLISEARYGFIAGALKETFVAKENKNPLSTSDKIDRVLTHKAYGFPIFLAFLWIVFQSTFSFGKYPVALIEAAVSLLGSGLEGILPSGMVKDLIITGIIGGAGSVLVFLPNILILFFFIAIMEDSGYMARVAFIMDKLMHRL
ncbi:MAG: GTP-binding protein, partial [Chlorobiales bacterium]|nr:GTP-binding protein [Chlorobiales bacterium]